MAFFNDLSKKISQTGQEVVKKTKDNTEIYRQENLIAEEKRKINSIFQQVGQLYYELHSDNYEDSFESLIGEIKSCEEKIAQCTEQIERVRGLKKCPQCGCEIPFDAKFCNSCGCHIEVKLNESAASSISSKCPSCGYDVSVGSAFCENCGSPIPCQQDDGTELNSEESKVVKCKNCGEDVSDSAFCANCGTKVD